MSFVLEQGLDLVDSREEVSGDTMMVEMGAE